MRVVSGWSRPERESMFGVGRYRVGGWRVADVGLVVSGNLALQADGASVWWHPAVVDDWGRVVAVWFAAPVLLEDVVPAPVVRRHRRVAGWA